MRPQTRHKRSLKAPRVTTLSLSHPAIVNSTTIFPTRIFAVDKVVRVLKSGENSKKIGRVITKGRWKGFPVFTLTTVPRLTCPTACKEWTTCYDAHLPYAQRIEPGPDLERALEYELGKLQQFNPKGFVVRLHVLGDFYSVEYILKWHLWLRKYPALNVMGFSAHPRFSLMGKMLAQPPWRRWAMRFSGEAAERGAVVIGDNDAMPAGTLPCPAQNKADPERTCSTCALCWQSQKPIAFRRH